MVKFLVTDELFLAMKFMVPVELVVAVVDLPEFPAATADLFEFLELKGNELCLRLPF